MTAEKEQTPKSPKESAETAEKSSEQQATETSPDNTESVKDVSDAQPAHPWEAELEEYPLRQPEDDPKWAVRIVQTWLGVALFSAAFVLTLLILGFFYD